MQTFHARIGEPRPSAGKFAAAKTVFLA